MKWKERLQKISHLKIGNIHFHHRIVSPMSARAVWMELAQAFTQSSSSSLWPKKLVSLKTESFDEGATVTAEYKAFGHRTKVHYKLSHIVPFETITYETAEDHIFSGGATVTVTNENGRTSVDWMGNYSYDLTGLVAVAFFRIYFEPRFFQELKVNLSRFTTELEAQEDSTPPPQPH